MKGYLQKCRVGGPEAKGGGCKVAFVMCLEDPVALAEKWLRTALELLSAGRRLLLAEGLLRMR